MCPIENLTMSLDHLILLYSSEMKRCGTLTQNINTSLRLICTVFIVKWWQRKRRNKDCNSSPQTEIIGVRLCIQGH